MHRLSQVIWSFGGSIPGRCRVTLAGLAALAGRVARGGAVRATLIRAGCRGAHLAAGLAAHLLFLTAFRINALFERLRAFAMRDAAFIGATLRRAPAIRTGLFGTLRSVRRAHVTALSTLSAHVAAGCAFLAGRSCRFTGGPCLILRHRTLCSRVRTPGIRGVLGIRERDGESNGKTCGQNCDQPFHTNLLVMNPPICNPGATKRSAHPTLRTALS